jgi:hypothetical protein
MDKATIINAALSRIGCLTITSVLQPGPQGHGVLLTYTSVIEFLLSHYPWHFTKTFAALSRLTATPGMGWTSAFLLPPDRLAMPRAYYASSADERPLPRFQILGNHVLTNTDELFAEYQRNWDPAYWPKYFTETATLALAAEYALEIREDQQLRTALRRDVYGPPEYMGDGGQIKIAQDLDAQAEASKQVAGGTNPLTDIRSDYGNDDLRGGW